MWKKFGAGFKEPTNLIKKWKLTINKRERLKNVLENKPVDYVPVLLFHHF